MSEPELVELLPCATPLHELLRRVPQDARLEIEHSPTHHEFVPVGRLAHEAADALERLSRSDVTEDEVERVARELYEQGIVEHEIAPAVARAAIAATRSAQQATSADNPSPRQSA